MHFIMFFSNKFHTSWVGFYALFVIRQAGAADFALQKFKLRQIYTKRIEGRQIPDRTETGSIIHEIIYKR